MVFLDFRLISHVRWLTPRPLRDLLTCATWRWRRGRLHTGCLSLFAYAPGRLLTARAELAPSGNRADPTRRRGDVRQDHARGMVRLCFPPCAHHLLLLDLHAGRMARTRDTLSSCPLLPKSSRSPYSGYDTTTHDSTLHFNFKRIRLQPHAPLFVKVALLPGTGGAPLASSGAYTDAHSGAATAQVALRAGNYLIVPTVDGVPHGDSTFSMVVYTSSAGIRLSPL